MIGYTVSAVQISANRRAAFLLAQALSQFPPVLVEDGEMKEQRRGVRIEEG
jgi:hypothetical protein